MDDTEALEHNEERLTPQTEQPGCARLVASRFAQGARDDAAALGVELDVVTAEVLAHGRSSESLTMSARARRVVKIESSTLSTCFRSARRLASWRSRRRASFTICARSIGNARPVIARRLRAAAGAHPRPGTDAR